MPGNLSWRLEFAPIHIPKHTTNCECKGRVLYQDHSVPEMCTAFLTDLKICCPLQNTKVRHECHDEALC